jgi:hypothetical protein
MIQDARVLPGGLRLEAGLRIAVAGAARIAIALDFIGAARRGRDPLDN